MNKRYLWLALVLLAGSMPEIAAAEQAGLPLIGTVDLESASMLFTTAAIGFVDGLNPYSLWGLVFLLGIVTAAGSRKKALIVGLVYLAVVGLVYGLMMVGLLNFFAHWGQGLIRIIVGVVAAVFALLNIHDYFRKKTDATVVTPKRQSRIKQRILQVMDPRNGISTLVSGTAIVALGITLLEFPLTFSLPMVWANIMARYEVSLLMFLLLLMVYLLIYLADEVIIFLSIVFALEKAKLNQSKEQALKLIGGIVILALASALILDLEALNTLAGSVTLFGGSLVAALLIMVLFPRRRT